MKGNKFVFRKHIHVKFRKKTKKGQVMIILKMKLTELSSNNERGFLVSFRFTNMYL